MNSNPKLETTSNLSALTCFLSGCFIPVMDIKLEQWSRREGRYQSGNWAATEALVLRDLERWGRTNRDTGVIDIERERWGGRVKKNQGWTSHDQDGQVLDCCVPHCWVLHESPRLWAESTSPHSQPCITRGFKRTTESTLEVVTENVWWGWLSKYYFYHFWLCTQEEQVAHVSAVVGEGTWGYIWSKRHKAHHFKC